jgi:AcrR family transcriptional regulator
VAAPRKLDRNEIVSAALELADAHGVESLSLRKIADALGVTPMALYRHIAGKAELLAAVADLLYAELVIPPVSHGWWADLAELARSTRRLAIAHPAAQELFSRFGTGPHAQRISDAIATRMREAGIPNREIAELHEQLAAMVFALTTASRSNAAFERGLEIVGVGLHARAKVRRQSAGRELRGRRAPTTR